jgi:hypothetical protein
MGVQEGGRTMKERLERLRRAIEEQDAQLAAAHGQLGPRDVVTLPPEVRERFEQLCTPPAPRPAAPAPTEWNALRC